jgi:hypothetical protein
MKTNIAAISLKMQLRIEKMRQIIHDVQNLLHNLFKIMIKNLTKLQINAFFLLTASAAMPVQAPSIAKISGTDPGTDPGQPFPDLTLTFLQPELRFMDKLSG